MKKLHNKTANELAIELIDEGIDVTPEIYKAINYIVEAYGCLPQYVNED